MERAAITGATGMIGSSLASRLSARGVSVVAIVNPASARLGRSISGDDPHIITLSCAGSEYADRASGPIFAEMGPVDVFYHFAWDGTIGKARADAERQQSNIQMTLDAVELAHAMGATRFVFAGSQAEYGMLDGAFSADTACHPCTEYGKAKLIAEGRARNRAHELGMEFIATRIGSVYGPGDNDGTVLIQAIRHAWQDEPFLCTGGEQMWDHIYCDDAAEAFRLIGDKGVPDAVYPIGTGRAVPLKDHIAMACKTCNPDFEPSFGAVDYPPGQVMYLCADISQLTEDTGFEAAMPFEEGIRRTAECCLGMLAPAAQKPYENYGGSDGPDSVS